MTRTMCVLWFAAGIALPQSVPSGAWIGTSDAHIRQWAIASPPPQYPPASLAKRITGVVVVTTLFTEQGAPQAVDIIQSPDAETGRSVREAILRWKLKPMPAPVQATLAFYFQMKGQTGVVLNPAEMRALISPGAKNVKREDEPPVKHITEAEYRALPTQPRPLLLDIRDRETFAEGHEKGAVNIPLREVLLRAPAELPVSRHVVIDCREPLDLCAMAVHWLASNGFERVSILRR